MRVLRQNKDSLIQLLTAFVHDPLISFRLLIPLIMKKHNNQFHINLKKEKSDENFEKNINGNNKNINVNNDNLNLTHKFSEDGFEKIRKSKIERQLYLQFEENEVESDNLNKIAILVLKRIIDKLQGTDFGEDDVLSINQQVERLINQATSHENLCQNYIGWSPFW
jgi:FKBP12-rapamycin complex-associated protein